MSSQRQVTIGEALNRFFANIFNFNGRASRSEFWFVALTVGLAAIALATPTAGLSTIAFGVLAVGLATRRLHDAGFSGWWQFVVFVPAAGWIALIVLLALPSDASPNKYGPVANAIP